MCPAGLERRAAQDWALSHPSGADTLQAGARPGWRSAGGARRVLGTLARSPPGEGGALGRSAGADTLQAGARPGWRSAGGARRVLGTLARSPP
ncbi:hypothetical protein AB0D33_25170, partial [Streptomyces sp. NPDC048404]